jgi:transcription-repair coupling factor (superfamily II helicase)
MTSGSSSFLQRSLERSLSNGNPITQISGLSSSVWLAQTLSRKDSTALAAFQHGLVMPTEEAVDEFLDALAFFSPKTKAVRLTAWDTSAYAQLFPSPRRTAERMGALYALTNAVPGSLVVGSVEAFLQRTLPQGLFLDSLVQLKPGLNFDEQIQKHLADIGYQPAPQVEDLGQFSRRGGILDVFSPAHDLPVRVEFFGDTIESLRHFDPVTQTSRGEISSAMIVPVREVMYTDKSREFAAPTYTASCQKRELPSHVYTGIQGDLARGRYFPGIDYLISNFFEEVTTPLEFLGPKALCWFVNEMDLVQEADLLRRQANKDFASSQKEAICPSPAETHITVEELLAIPVDRKIFTSRLQMEDTDRQISEDAQIPFRSRDLQNISREAGDETPGARVSRISKRILGWREEGYSVFLGCSTQSQAQRLKLFLEQNEVATAIVDETAEDWAAWSETQAEDYRLIHIIPRALPASGISPDENVVFLQDDDLLARKSSRRFHSASQRTDESSVAAFDFADFNPGDFVVHIEHGVAKYEGLKKMLVQGIEAEFIALQFRDNDRLYLPIYRVAQIQKYGQNGTLDKLGGTSWQKAKIKVRAHLKDVAADLLRLYAERSQVQRPRFTPPDSDYREFESAFPYEETQDQVKTISAVLSDLQKDQPMDRLVCGDVGFGKTEVALRAAFKCVEDRRQAAILVPTTVLAFQHFETFAKRMRPWPIKIGSLSRFTSKEDSRKCLEQLKSGELDVVIGTHRLLSKDVTFKNLGLLVIDEEQRFGVTHKEKIRKLKVAVDTLTLSATPIPRTLNMSLVGLRDLSLIQTAPIDRLPVRTYVAKRNEEMIRKSILSELARGGQIFFVHNRVQSIYEVLAELKALVPEARFDVGHGQLEEDQLEDVMLRFLKHEFDVLLCTTIIESGIDISNANTIIIDRADTFGLSQLYQLRGRVGRSKERAYCYLFIPPHAQIDPIAQERLKTLQENTALGSGFRIAHYDLELRGAGSILGEAQSGFVNAVGYDLYLELLQEALADVKGEPIKASVEPEINLKIPAFIPDEYMPDIRSRLNTYRRLTSIKSAEDLDRIESELRDQYGGLPDQVLNLLGVMLIRHDCKELGIRDVSAGTKTISLAFTDSTPLSPQKVIQLTNHPNKKFSLTPDSRLIIRMNNITWPAVHEELVALMRL